MLFRSWPMNTGWSESQSPCKASTSRGLLARVGATARGGRGLLRRRMAGPGADRAAAMHAARGARGPRARSAAGFVEQRGRRAPLSLPRQQEGCGCGAMRDRRPEGWRDRVARATGAGAAGAHIPRRGRGPPRRGGGEGRLAPGRAALCVRTAWSAVPEPPWADSSGLPWRKRLEGRGGLRCCGAAGPRVAAYLA